MTASSQEKETTAFSQHQQQDAALQTNSPQAQRPQDEGISLFAKMLLYLGVPFFCGTAGLYIGYIRTLQDKQPKINFDVDFVLPFLLALALVVVISFQTKGFSTQVTPLVQWPKVKRKRKIIRKQVLVDEHGNEVKESGKED